MDSILTTPRVSYEENLIKDIARKKIEIYAKINLEIDNDLIKQKL